MDGLYRIEGEIIEKRFKKLYDDKAISLQTFKISIKDINTLSERVKLYRFLDAVETEWRRSEAETIKEQQDIAAEFAPGVI